MNILVLSPHRDDAAFSLGLAIRGWLAQGDRVTVLGVFTRSLHAPYSDAETIHPNDLLSYVSAMRRREDAEFLKLMPGLRMIDLNLKDAPLRLRCTADLYTLAPSPEDTAIPKIHKVLAKLSAEQTVDVVLLPLALGHHVDHLVVRNAALPFASAHAFAFYEDFPDAFQSGTDLDASVHAEVAALHESNLFTGSLSPAILSCGEDIAVSLKIKRRIVSVYASQIDDAAIDEIGTIASNRSGGERVWANHSWPALNQ